jgi:hypothetical protein
LSRHKTIAVAVVLSLVLVAVASAQATRTLQGQVMKDGNAPLPGAVVYLKNTKTLAIRTFVSDPSGNYRFASLSPNVDYEVYADFKGAKSDTKTLSAFDTRPTAIINLKLSTK